MLTDSFGGDITSNALNEMVGNPEYFHAIQGYFGSDRCSHLSPRVGFILTTLGILGGAFVYMSVPISFSLIGNNRSIDCDAIKSQACIYVRTESQARCVYFGC